MLESRACVVCRVCGESVERSSCCGLCLWQVSASVYRLREWLLQQRKKARRRRRRRQSRTQCHGAEQRMRAPAPTNKIIQFTIECRPHNAARSRTEPPTPAWRTPPTRLASPRTAATRSVTCSRNRRPSLPPPRLRSHPPRRCGPRRRPRQWRPLRPSRAHPPLPLVAARRLRDPHRASLCRSSRARPALATLATTPTRRLLRPARRPCRSHPPPRPLRSRPPSRPHQPAAAVVRAAACSAPTRPPHG